MRNYLFFWGCVIPTRFPFLEKSTRMVLDSLGISFIESDEFTCCPEKFLVETISEDAWYLTAARNLAIAESMNSDLLVTCNGCYSTFRQAVSAFSSNSALRKRISKELEEMGLEFNFRASVIHMVELLHDTITPDVIARKVRRPLSGINIAVHYGCQLLRPSPVVRFDDPARPGKLDRLVESLGSTSVDYHSKLLCCGEALGRTGNTDRSLATTRVKLLELDQLDVDALVVICPACFMQFDNQQVVLKKFKEDLHVPVFYLTELLGLALGLDPVEMGLDMHRISVQRFFDRWQERERALSEIPPVFDLKAISTCVRCGSCANDCPVTQVDEDFVPHQILKDLLNGKVEEVVESPQIWKCLECGTCTELCPNNFGMSGVLKEAKRLAIDRGFMPVEMSEAISMFKKTGMLGKPRQRIREKLGLKPICESGAEEVRKMLEGILEKGEGS